MLLLLPGKPSNAVLTMYQAYKHKLQLRTADSPKTHTPKYFPNPPFRIFVLVGLQRASLKVGRNDYRDWQSLGRDAQKHLVDGWTLDCG